MGESVETHGGPCRILLVEDHEDTARVTARLLGLRGYAAVVAASAGAAIELADRQRFDVIVSDLGLPDLDGYALLGELHRRLGRVPAIALSGFGPEDDVHKVKAAGFAEHLTKPVDFHALLAVIERLL